jgi:hypothetical protein
MKPDPKHLPLSLLFGLLVSLLFKDGLASSSSSIRSSSSGGSSRRISHHHHHHESKHKSKLSGGGLVARGPFQAFVATISEAKSQLTAAAIARSSSLLACYPIDTVKVRPYNSPYCT